MSIEEKMGEEPRIVNTDGLLNIYCQICGWKLWGISPEVVERYPIASKALMEMALNLLRPLHRHDK